MGERWVSGADTETTRPLCSTRPYVPVQPYENADADVHERACRRARTRKRCLCANVAAAPLVAVRTVAGSVHMIQCLQSAHAASSRGDTWEGEAGVGVCADTRVLSTGFALLTTPLRGHACNSTDI